MGCSVVISKHAKKWSAVSVLTLLHTEVAICPLFHLNMQKSIFH